mgnify:FL=1
MKRYIALYREAEKYAADYAIINADTVLHYNGLVYFLRDDAGILTFYEEDFLEAIITVEGEDVADLARRIADLVSMERNVEKALIELTEPPDGVN